jgi:TRAP transporter TAXI family solute receptor
MQDSKGSVAVRLALYTLLIAFAGIGIASAQTATELFLDRKNKSNENTVSIMAAGITGTYAPIAQDIQTVVDETDRVDGMRVLPILGRGGGANVLDILFLRGVDMGITQQEHLEYFKRQNPVLYGDIYNRVHYITKLYNSEYHILVPKSITHFDQLEGKKVNFYKEESATAIANSTLFAVIGVKVEPTHMELKESIDKLRTGELAASTYMGGVPVSGFASGLKAEDNFHFLPLSPETLPPGGYEKLLKVFLPATLPQEPYSVLIPKGETVATIASGAVLAVYNWPENSDRYRRVANFVKVFFDKFDKFLDPSRHPKWKEINLAGTVPQWRRFKAAQDWIDQQKYSGGGGGADAMKVAFEQFLERQPAGARDLSQQQRDKLFKDFVSWWQTQDRPPR